VTIPKTYDRSLFEGEYYVLLSLSWY